VVRLFCQDESSRNGAFLLNSENNLRKTKIFFLVLLNVIKKVYFCQVINNEKHRIMIIIRTQSELKKAVAVLKRTYFNMDTEICILFYKALNGVKTNEDLDMLFSYKDTYQKTKEESVRRACLDCIQFEYIDLNK